MRYTRNVTRTLLVLLFLFVAMAVAWGQGAVYMETNNINKAANAVSEYARASDGTLTFVNSYSTTGTGRFVGTHSQGAVELSNDNSLLFAVNSGTNDVTSFVVQNPNGLVYANKVSSGGKRPVSLTVHGNVLYVLNFGTVVNGVTYCSNITGFTFDTAGNMTPLNSTQPVSSCMPNVVEVGFSADGTLLVVTEVGSNLVDVYTVNSNGTANPPVVQSSNGGGPFGFSFDAQNRLYITEAGTASTSSYSVSPTGVMTTISKSVKDFQATPCWLAVATNPSFPTPYVFVTNTIGHTISSYAIAADGSLTLAQEKTGGLPGTSQPIDIAASPDGKFLYLNNHVLNTLVAFGINSDGSLTTLQTVSVLKGMAGTAAR